MRRKQKQIVYTFYCQCFLIVHEPYFSEDVNCIAVRPSLLLGIVDILWTCVFMRFNCGWCLPDRGDLTQWRALCKILPAAAGHRGPSIISQGWHHPRSRPFPSCDTNMRPDANAFRALSYLDVSVHGRVTSNNCSPSVLSILLFENTVKWRPRSSKRLTVAKVNTLKECRRCKKKSFHYNERFLILVSIVTFYLFITRRFLLRNEVRRYPLYDWWFHADSSYSRNAHLFDFTGQRMCWMC